MNGPGAAGPVILGQDGLQEVLREVMHHEALRNLASHKGKA
ncbi:MAG: hypothetical protein PHN49_03210 [Candidatus Omnitrophica bacterium]|nr:hypothetical protein [Candidatus Omnitrophota bacterium]MDD5670629.1 hypothetical protein [Candidatus Omnitrophota bacterium]